MYKNGNFFYKIFVRAFCRRRFRNGIPPVRGKKVKMFRWDHSLQHTIIFPRRRDAVQATAVLGVLAIEFSHESMCLHDIG